MVRGALLTYGIPLIYFSRNLCPSPEKALGCKNNEAMCSNVQSCRQWPGLLGQEPAVCSSVFPFTGPSGAAGSQNQSEKALTHKADVRGGS